MFVPDALSRLPSANTPVEEHITLPNMIHAVEAILHMSDERLAQFKAETKKDRTLTLLCECIRKGWPSNRRDLPSDLTPFHTYHDELVEVDGLVLRENRIVVPKACGGRC